MIAREGIPLILFGLLLTTVLVWFAAASGSLALLTIGLLCGFMTIGTAFFFRDPERTCKTEPGSLIAPADGRIVAVDTTAEHPFVGGAAVRISIFLSIFDVHVNRVPAGGTIDYVKYNRGEFLPAFASKASELNEHAEIGMTTSSGEKLVFKQIAGVIARRVVCHLNKGDRVAPGERFGMIRFGSRTDLIVSIDSEIDVKVGDRVTGGETVVGRLRRQGRQAEQAAAARSESGD